MHGNKPKILLIEDNELNSKYIRKSLEILNYELIGTAASRNDALSLLENTLPLPDLILLDISLQGDKDGVDTANEIRAHYEIPIVYTTVHSDKRTFDRANQTEPYGYLLKPFDLSDLGRTIEIALHKASVERKLKSSERWLKTVLMNLGESVLATDSNYLVNFINSAAERITGWDRDSALGKNISEILNISASTGHTEGNTDESPGSIQVPGSSSGKSPRSGVSVQRTAPEQDTPGNLAGVQDGRPCLDELFKTGKNKPAVLISKSGVEAQIEMTVMEINDGTSTGFIYLCHDTSERKKREIEQKRITQLERSNRELEHFAFITSHDLQEPLRTITTFTQLLQEGYSSQLGSEANRLLEVVVRSATKMHQLIADVLAYSRVDVVHSSFDQVDCNAVLADVQEELKVAIEDSGAIIESEKLPLVHSNKTIVLQLFQNIIGNAIKFCGPEPLRIHIRATSKGDYWQFAIQDNGIGIKEEYRDTIFGMFKRLHSDDRYPGTGIGLSLCKKIVELHGGKIWVTSKPGKGATFLFTLPKSLS